MPSPCKALSQHNTTCLDLLYPPIDVAVSRADATDAMPFSEVADDGTERELEKVPYYSLNVSVCFLHFT